MKELQQIQTELKAPKNQYNKFGKYAYRSCEDILEAVKPLLAKYNCTLTESDEVVAIGNFIFLKATATIENSSGDTRTTTAFARHADSQAGMADAQLTGSTSSYARKYALNGLFCIDDNKDDDATNDHGKGDKPQNNYNKPQSNYSQPQKNSATPPKTAGNAPTSANVITLEQCKALAEIGKRVGLTREEMGFIAWSVAGVNSAKEIPQDKYNAVAIALQDAIPGKVYQTGGENGE